jgi:hypothetical protein
MYLKLLKIRRRRKIFITPCKPKAQLGAKGQTFSLRNSVGVQPTSGLRGVRYICLPRVSLRFTRGYVHSRPAVLFLKNGSISSNIFTGLKLK